MNKETIIELMSGQARKLNGQLASYHKYSLSIEAFVDIEKSIKTLDELLAELKTSDEG
jgi:hypothetical protein